MSTLAAYLRFAMSLASSPDELDAWARSPSHQEAFTLIPEAERNQLRSYYMGRLREMRSC